MGNPDIIVVINDKNTFTIKGQQYTTREEALKIALEAYYNLAKEGINLWYKAEKETPEMIDKDFDIETFWEIKVIRIF